MVNGLESGQRHCVPGLGLFQGLGIGVPKSGGSLQVQMLHGFGFGFLQVQMLHGFGFFGLLRTGAPGKTPGLFRFASAGAVPIIQTKESIRGKAINFFMFI